jgi:hypothetical protein
MENILRVRELEGAEISQPWPPESMSWEINPQKEKTMFHQILIKSFFFSLALTIISLGRIATINITDAFSIFFWFMIFFAIVFAIIFAISYKVPFAQRRYEFNKDDLMIQKGSKSGRFSWEELDYFYADPNEKTNLGLGTEGAAFERELIAIMGRIFYLKLKPKSFLLWLSPVALTVRTNPQNCQQVYDFLLSKLPEGQCPSLVAVRVHFK